MPVKEISVALDPDVAETATAQAHGQSLSAWLNDAARARLTVERGRLAVQQWQDEQGALTDEERASADALLDELLGGSHRCSA
jgi:hypothetical protein